MRWRKVLPIVGALVVVAWPFLRYAAKARDESRALQAVRRIGEAQASFRALSGTGAYATSVDSLTIGCANTPAAMSVTVLDELEAAGYEVQLRAAVAARTVATDCQGRPTADDFYVGAQPRSADRAAQRAFAATSQGIFAFFDAVAPAERDMAHGGLAIPVDALTAFKIP